MLDIKFIRENPDLVRQAAKNKHVEVDIEELLDVDKQKRHLQLKINELEQQRNHAARAKDIEKGKSLKSELLGLEQELKKVESVFQALLLKVPNIYSEDTPVGPDESGNLVLKKFGELPKFDFQPKEHWQLGAELGLIDMEKAAEISGARFAYLFKELVLLQYAIVQFIFQILTSQERLAQIIAAAGLDVTPKPFVPVVPPVFIRPDVMRKMGRLEPTEQRYYIPSDDLYLIGSAEHTLGPLHMDETLAEQDLPLRYAAFSPAFRREAGSYGKDMKGILRVHQFEKLEMESLTLPEQGLAEQHFLVAIQEYIWQQFKLPYQVVQICTADMGALDYRQIDIETWLPGQNKYRETHTSDFMTDYQSRRLNTKVRRTDDKTELVYMNDATAAAIGRTIIAIMENYQQADGSIKIPEVLLPYMSGLTEIRH